MFVFLRIGAWTLFDILFKRIAILMFLALSAFRSSAQMTYNYYAFAAGLQAGYERAFTNIKKQYNHFNYDLNIIYNYSPYIPVTLDLQKGTFSGGGLMPALDKFGRQYVNQYNAIFLYSDFGLGEVIDYSDGGWRDFVKNIFFGTGVGIVINSNKVQRYNIYPWNGPLTYRFPGKDQSVNLSLPLRFGYEIKLYDRFNEPGFAIDVGYVHSLVFGEGLDGYDDPQVKFKNNATNQFRQIFLGIKINFGMSTAFVKPIRY